MATSLSFAQLLGQLARLLTAIDQHLPTPVAPAFSSADGAELKSMRLKLLKQVSRLIALTPGEVKTLPQAAVTAAATAAGTAAELSEQAALGHAPPPTAATCHAANQAALTAIKLVR